MLARIIYLLAICYLARSPKLPGFEAADPGRGGSVGTGGPLEDPLAAPLGVLTIPSTAVSDLLGSARRAISCSIHCCCSGVKIGGGECGSTSGCASSVAIFPGYRLIKTHTQALQLHVSDSNGVKPCACAASSVPSPCRTTPPASNVRTSLH